MSRKLSRSEFRALRDAVTLRVAYVRAETRAREAHARAVADARERYFAALSDALHEAPPCDADALLVRSGALPATWHKGRAR